MDEDDAVASTLATLDYQSARTTLHAQVKSVLAFDPRIRKVPIIIRFQMSVEYLV